MQMQNEDIVQYKFETVYTFQTHAIIIQGTVQE